MSKKKIKWFKKVVVVAFCCLMILYALPFIYLKLGRQDIGYLVTKVIAEKSTENCDTDSLKALHLMRFLSDKFIEVKGSSPKDGSPYEELLNDEAICDQQVNIFICLARRLDINGRMIFLRGNDSISRHALAELEINGEYKMFGVYFNKVFLNKQNCLATIADVQSRNIKKGNMDFLTRYHLTEKDYFHFFDKKYPYIVFLDNKVNFTTSEKINHSILDTWYFVFGDIGLKPYLHYYFKKDKISLKTQKRIKRLVY